MKRSTSLDIALVAMSAFCAVALVAAAALSVEPQPANAAIEFGAPINDAAALQAFAEGSAPASGSPTTGLISSEAGNHGHGPTGADPDHGMTAAGADDGHGHPAGADSDGHGATAGGDATHDRETSAGGGHDGMDGHGDDGHDGMDGHGDDGHDGMDEHGDEPSDATVLYEQGGRRLQYEPATETRGAALRLVDDNADAGHGHGGGDCTPTAEQQAYADRFLAETKAAVSQYDDKPQKVFADGFVVYPIFGNRFFHVSNPRRTDDEFVLEPDHIESFMYAYTNDGWRAIGGMYVMPKSFKDKKMEELPNPTGCILQWHKHDGAVQGTATSFDPNNAQTSVWMTHVWTFGGVDPWQDYDGTTWSPHTPLAPIPSLCYTDCI